MKDVTITANVDEDTKTAYSETGAFSWTEGDQISVLASDYNYYKFTATKSGATTTFEGKIPADASLLSHALFPYSEGHHYDAATWYTYFHIDEYKDMKGSFSADMPMYGVKADEGNAFSFKHLTGAARLTFTNVPAGVESVKVSLKNEQCKFSGDFKLSTSSWGWEADYSTNDSELTYTRVLPVEDNTVQMYLPYCGGIWYASNLSIVGYKNGKELNLLQTTMKGNSTPFDRAVVVPYTALALPEYVEPVDWTTVDWTTVPETQVYVQPDWFVAEYSAYVALTEMKVVADANYVYAQVKPNMESEIKRIRFKFADTQEGTNEEWYWNTTYVNAYKSEWAYLTDGVFAPEYNGSAVSFQKNEVDGQLVWNFAFPRAAHELTKSSGTVHFGMFTKGSGDENGFAPMIWNAMMVVTLP